MIKDIISDYSSCLDENLYLLAYFDHLQLLQQIVLHCFSSVYLLYFHISDNKLSSFRWRNYSSYFYENCIHTHLCVFTQLMWNMNWNFSWKYKNILNRLCCQVLNQVSFNFEDSRKNNYSTLSSCFECWRI